MNNTLQKTLRRLSLVALVLGTSTALRAQSGTHVFAGAEAVNFGTLDLATPSGHTWSTFRGAAPGYLSAVGTASYTNPADAAANVNGYVKHYANAADQSFSFPVGTGADYREVAVSGTRTAAAELAVAWIVGNPTTTADPTAPNAGLHDITAIGTGIVSICPEGQWDWQNVAGNDVATVTVSIPDMSGFGITAAHLRLVGWDGTQWVNLGGTTGASGLAENSTLSGTMIAGITALGVGIGETFSDFGDNSLFTTVSAIYTDTDLDGTPDATGSVWLGSAVSAEPTGTSNAVATADATGDDGFTMPPVGGGTIDHTITLSASSATTAFYYVHIVTSSATIVQTGSHTFTAAGSTTITLSPAALNGYMGTIDYRVVAATSAADAAAAITGTSFTNGEVEDYQRIYTTPLPVDLIEQAAVWAGADALVTWSTASEINNERFDVYRSMDGEYFELAGTVASQARGGNSDATLSYRFVDAQIAGAVADRIYYQIRQYDFDGTTESFKVLTLKKEQGEQPFMSFVVYPNPNTGDNVNLRVSSSSDEDLNIFIYNSLGVIVQSSVALAFDNGVHSIDTKALSNGAYYVALEQGDNREIKQLLIH